MRPRDRLFDAEGRRKKSQQEQLQVKPMFVVAHELYDALPIHQFKYQGDGNWSEMVVKLEGVQYNDQSQVTLDTQINSQ